MAKRPPFNPKRNRAIQHIEEADWDDIVDRVTAYAAWYVRVVRRWEIGPDGAVPGGRTLSDFFHDALAKVLQYIYATKRPNPADQRSARGSRKWNPDTHSLTGTLCRYVRSEIDNYGRELTRRGGFLAKEQAEAIDGLDAHWRSVPSRSAFDTVEQGEAYREWMEAVGDRHLASQITHLILVEGIQSFTEMALRLGVPRTKIFSEKAWMRRNLDPSVRARKGGGR